MTFLLKGLLVIWLLGIICHCTQVDRDMRPTTLLSYTRDQLLLLRSSHVSAPLLPRELLRNPTGGRRSRSRKRGKRGGVRQRLRRRENRPPLPSMLLCNVRSLKSKMEELKINARFLYEYRESCLLVFTESWLQEDVPDSLLSMDGFSLVRQDRDALSGKIKGGGICVYVKNKWCSQFTTRESLCTPDIELLCLSLRPFYLPREFGNILLCTVYIPPSGNAFNAANAIVDCVHRQLERTPEAPCLILGDFNHCKLDAALPGFSQYVNCSTRGKNILDKCYGNVKNAYIARVKPPLGSSDHNAVHLIPTYKSLLKSSKPQTKTIFIWDNEGIETLRGCFSCTDWGLFHNLELEEATDTITEYIKFCKENVLPQKVITMYPNNKSYISKELKRCIVQKKIAFKNGDMLSMKNIQKEINYKLRTARDETRKKFESECLGKSSRKLWDSVKVMTKMTPSKSCINVMNEEEKANELNNFFCRFETRDFSHEQKAALDAISVLGSEKIIVDQHVVERFFSHMCPRKASGPDGISGRLLKSCSEELAEAWSPIYQKSLDTCSVPVIWKSSIIIPVPKKASCKENNDYRPVALTSLVMKCLEKIVTDILKTDFGGLLDPLQFAYKNNRSTEDAILTLTHSVFKHLEETTSYARLLLVDFSSAFNTLQPHLLIKRLNDFKVHPVIIKWYHSFLTYRKQQVSVNGTLSKSRTLSTGAPQGCVSSPFLFTLYTDECRSVYPGNQIIKFSDDTAILSLLQKTHDLSSYFIEIQRFVNWCDDSHLILNTDKTKEMVFDPRGVGDHRPVVIHNHTITQVSSYKYLGVFIDNSLTWSTHIDYLCSRLQQRLHFLRRLRIHGVDKRIMLIFYQAVLESCIRYSITAWFGNLSVKLKNRVLRLIHTAWKIIGVKEYLPMQILHDQAACRQAQKIISDMSHVLNNEYVRLPSGRRYRVPKCRFNRYKNSFIPTSVKLLNSDK